MGIPTARFFHSRIQPLEPDSGWLWYALILIHLIHSTWGFVACCHWFLPLWWYPTGVLAPQTVNCPEISPGAIVPWCHGAMVIPRYNPFCLGALVDISPWPRPDIEIYISTWSVKCIMWNDVLFICWKVTRVSLPDAASRVMALAGWWLVQFTSPQLGTHIAGICDTCSTESWVNLQDSKLQNF